MELFAIELRVSDWPAAVAWYRDRFGMTLSLLDEQRYYALFAEGVALKVGTPARTRLLFHVDDLDAALIDLNARCLMPDSPPRTDAEGYRSATFRDPDGHELVVFEWSALSESATAAQM